MIIVVIVIKIAYNSWATHLLLKLLEHAGPQLACHHLVAAVALALARRRLCHWLVAHHLPACTPKSAFV